MAERCIHGLRPGECLICRTLPASAGGPLPPPFGTVPPVRRRRSIHLHLTGVAASIVVIGLIAWVAVGLVFAALHILELALVAAAAGWAGYRLGHFRGAHRRGGG